MYTLQIPIPLLEWPLFTEINQVSGSKMLSKSVGTRKSYLFGFCLFYFLNLGVSVAGVKSCLEWDGMGCDLACERMTILFVRLDYRIRCPT